MEQRGDLDASVALYLQRESLVHQLEIACFREGKAGDKAHRTLDAPGQAERDDGG